MLENYREIEDTKTLQEELPPKPYCSDDLKTGLRVRPRDIALGNRYIQLNPPHQRVFLTFDLDYRTWAYVADDVNLPRPIWCVGNKENGHAHLIYVLKYPVYTTSAAHLAPLKWLAAIEAAMRQRLEADPMYSGLISKNPWSDFWIVYNTGNLAYDLAYLAGSVELIRKPTKKPVSEIAGLGRNCFVFENVRVWAYREVRRHWGTREGEERYTDWMNAVKYRCQEENAKFTTPLDSRELWGIAKSIARWVWKRMRPCSFSEWQSKQASHRWNSKMEQGISLLKSGMTTLEVAEVLEVSERTCYRWKELSVPKREIILPEEYRGVDGKQRLAEQEGISRATYYRRQQEDGEHVAPLSESKPWEAMGISRRTWERRRK